MTISPDAAHQLSQESVNVPIAGSLAKSTSLQERASVVPAEGQ
jgi:hypothetical protein